MPARDSGSVWFSVGISGSGFSNFSKQPDHEILFFLSSHDAGGFDPFRLNSGFHCLVLWLPYEPFDVSIGGGDLR